MPGITEREINAVTAVPAVAGGKTAKDETEAFADFRFCDGWRAIGHAGWLSRQFQSIAKRQCFRQSVVVENTTQSA